jgi:hypothetical protein
MPAILIWREMVMSSIAFRVTDASHLYLEVDGDVLSRI